MKFLILIATVFNFSSLALADTETVQIRLALGQIICQGGMCSIPCTTGSCGEGVRNNNLPPLKKITLKDGQGEIDLEDNTPIKMTSQSTGAFYEIPTHSEYAVGITKYTDNGKPTFVIETLAMSKVTVGEKVFTSNIDLTGMTLVHSLAELNRITFGGNLVDVTGKVKDSTGSDRDVNFQYALAITVMAP